VGVVEAAWGEERGDSKAWVVEAEAVVASAVVELAPFYCC
jgi:hypothetical protein